MQQLEEFEFSFLDAFADSMPPEQMEAILASVKEFRAQSDIDMGSYIDHVIDGAMESMLIIDGASHNSTKRPVTRPLSMGSNKKDVATSVPPTPKNNAEAVQEDGWQIAGKKTKVSPPVQSKSVPAHVTQDTHPCVEKSNKTSEKEEEAIAVVRSLMPAEITDASILFALRKNEFNVDAAIIAIYDSCGVCTDENLTSLPVPPRQLASAKASAITPAPAPRPTPTGSSTTVLSLLKDAAQIKAFHSLRAMFSQDLEDWYLLDTLMTYQFDLATAIGVIFEDQGTARMSYGNALSLGSDIGSAKSKKGHVDITKVIKQSFIVSSASARETELPTSTASVPTAVSKRGRAANLQAIHNLSSFNWTHTQEQSHRAMSVLHSFNPQLIFQVRETDGQVQFCGQRPQQQKNIAAGGRNNSDILIDLHNCVVKIALEVVCSALLFYANAKQKGSRPQAGGGCGSSGSSSSSTSAVYVIRLIFGLGTHSVDGKCVLQAAICSFLDRKNITHEVTMDRAGTTIKI